MQCNHLKTPQPCIIPLWPDGAPGSEGWTQQEEVSAMPQGGLKVVRNVTQPTLTAYLPESEDRKPGTR